MLQDYRQKVCSYGTPKMKKKQLGFENKIVTKFSPFLCWVNEKWTCLGQSIQEQRNEDFWIWPHNQM